jgi:hypothetical protein
LLLFSHKSTTGSIPGIKNLGAYVIVFSFECDARVDGSVAIIAVGAPTASAPP